MPANPYLGVMISNDLKWNVHINNICNKASSTLGFVRRNIQNCPIQTRRAAYLTLVRSQLEYAAAVWDPYTSKEMEKLEKVQRRAARFISRDYKSRETGWVTKMLQEHNLPPPPTKTKGNKVGPLLQDCQRIPPWSSSCRVPDPHSKQETNQGDKIRWLCVQKCRREPPD